MLINLHLFHFGLSQKQLSMCQTYLDYTYWLDIYKKLFSAFYLNCVIS